MVRRQPLPPRRVRVPIVIINVLIIIFRPEVTTSRRRRRLSFATAQDGIVDGCVSCGMHFYLLTDMTRSTLIQIPGSVRRSLRRRHGRRATSEYCVTAVRTRAQSRCMPVPRLSSPVIIILRVMLGP